MRNQHPTDHLVKMRGTAALRCAQFHAIEPDIARRFFSRAYTPSWHLGDFAKGSAIAHRRCRGDAITVDDLMIEGRVTCEVRTTDSVIVIRPRAGALSIDTEPTTKVETPILVADGMPCLLQVNTARFAAVTIDASLVRSVAAGQGIALPPRFQFVGSLPRSHAVVQTWDRALNYVMASFACADTAQRPLMVSASAHLLAAAVLECFPSNLAAAEDLLANPAIPLAFKGALSFIQRHAGHGIGINDVAAAVQLSPRAVQYLFRRQLDTTPTEYLRRVRLHRAHQDLLNGDRSSTTVTEIAQRWGFAHTGRFAVLYRQTYGQSPHTTLKKRVC